MLLVILLTGGVVALLVRSGALSIGGMLAIPGDAPPCPSTVNRWADQRLTATRAQLEKEHGLYRSAGEVPNAIAAAMTWIDDRLIDQRVDEARQQIRSSLLKSSQCLVQFQP